MTTIDTDLLFRLLRQIDAAPQASQRATAQALGISLGGLNTALRAVTQAGLVRIVERDSTDRRQKVAYTLTQKGAAEKSRLVDAFLARKPVDHRTHGIKFQPQGVGAGVLGAQRID